MYYFLWDNVQNSTGSISWICWSQQAELQLFLLVRVGISNSFGHSSQQNNFSSVTASKYLHSPCMPWKWFLPLIMERKLQVNYSTVELLGTWLFGNWSQLIVYLSKNSIDAKKTPTSQKHEKATFQNEDNINHIWHISAWNALTGWLMRISDCILNFDKKILYYNTLRLISYTFTFIGQYRFYNSRITFWHDDQSVVFNISTKNWTAKSLWCHIPKQE